ncbi:hypothetical protein N9164_03075 [Draconibacterium sp.]|nr:hypothetical protein [Draconibacterium sp.]
MLSKAAYRNPARPLAALPWHVPYYVVADAKDVMRCRMARE